MSITLDLPLGVPALADVAVKLFPDGSDAPMTGVLSCTEYTNRKGVYHATVPNSTGLAYCAITMSGTEIGQCWVYLEPDSLCVGESERSSVWPNASLCNKLADHVRRRSQANVESSSNGDPLSLSSEYGFIQQAQESNTVTHLGKLTVFKTDGTTELGQKNLMSEPGADAVTGIS